MLRPGSHAIRVSRPSWPVTAIRIASTSAMTTSATRSGNTPSKFAWTTGSSQEKLTSVLPTTIR